MNFIFIPIVMALTFLVPPSGDAVTLPALLLMLGIFLTARSADCLVLGIPALLCLFGAAGWFLFNLFHNPGWSAFQCAPLLLIVWMVANYKTFRGLPHSNQ